MGAFAVPLMIASTVVSTIGAINQAQAQSAAYKAQAQANNYNATVQRQNAEVARRESTAQQEIQQRKFDALQAEAEAGIAQSGTGFNGSNIDLLRQNKLNNELDKLTIRYAGDEKARGYQAQSDISAYNSRVNLANADNAITAGYFNAGANLLSGANKYAYYSQTGKLPGMG